MSSNPKRRLLDQFGTSPTFIAEGCRVIGDIETRGACMLAGEVRGNGEIATGVSLSAGAAWHGDIRAQHGIIAGTVIGNVVVAEKLEIGAAAVIRGSIIARTVAIARGARVEGKVTVTSEAPVIHFDEKRQG